MNVESPSTDREPQASSASYSYSPETSTAQTPPIHELSSAPEQFARIIQLVVCVVLIVVWTVVGFLFWIPFLVRAIGAYTTAVLGATFTGASLYSAQRGLDTAVRFWFAGYQVVLESRHSTSSPLRATRLEEGPPLKHFVDQLLGHLLFALLFWCSAVALWIAIWRRSMVTSLVP